MFCRTSDWMVPAIPPPDIEFKSYNGENNLLNKYLSKVKLSVCKMFLCSLKACHPPARLPASPLMDYLLQNITRPFTNTL